MHVRLWVVFCFVAQLAWAIDSAVVGQWKSVEGQDVTLMEIKADGATVLDGDHFTLQADGGKMKLAHGSGATIDATYTLTGSTLVITMLGEKQTWQRVGGPPASVSRAAPEPAAAPATPGVANAPKPAGNPTVAAGTPPAAATNAPAGGNWLRRPDEGFDLLLPGDFRVLRQQNGGILLGSNVTPGIIIVFPNPVGTPADLERLRTQGVQDGGISMRPQGAVRDVQLEGSSGKLMEVAGTLEQTRAQGLLGGYLRTEGTGGIAILAATTPESWPTLKPLAEEAVRGVRLFKPMASDRLLKARQALAGHSLVASFNNSTTSQNSSGYYTGTATNSFRAWHCCATGRGRYEGARSSSFQGGGLIGASESGPGSYDGNWELQAQGNDFLLTFRFDRGGSASWTVTVDANDNVFVDNTRVKVTTDSICDRL